MPRPSIPSNQLLLSILEFGENSEECALTNTQHFFFLTLNTASVWLNLIYHCKKNLLF